MQKNIKGLGKTGLDIFFRRVQGLWEETYPFVDLRTGDALDTLGLPAAANDLRKLVDNQWNELEIEHISGKDEEDKKRSAFVRILERAVGASLEGNLDDIRTAAEE